MYVYLAMGALMCTTTLFAQKPEQKRQQLTPEQRIERQAARMDKELMLDDETSAKFLPLYKEYLQAMAECRNLLRQVQENTHHAPSGKDFRPASQTFPPRAAQSSLRSRQPMLPTCPSAPAFARAMTESETFALRLQRYEKVLNYAIP